jgi:hypothetical protein
MLPDNRECPLGHNIRKNKNGAQILLTPHIRSGHEIRENSSEQDGNHTGEHGQKDRVHQRFPQVCPGQPARKKINVIDKAVAAAFSGQMLVDGAGMNDERIPDNRDDRGKRTARQNNAEQQQYDILRLYKKSLDLIQENGGLFLSGNRILHGNLPSIESDFIPIA